MLVSMYPPPPPLRLFSSLVHKIENNLTFSWLKATQTINLFASLPPPPFALPPYT